MRQYLPAHGRFPFVWLCSYDELRRPGRIAAATNGTDLHQPDCDSALIARQGEFIQVVGNANELASVIFCDYHEHAAFRGNCIREAPGEVVVVEGPVLIFDRDSDSTRRLGEDIEGAATGCGVFHFDEGEGADAGGFAEVFEHMVLAEKRREGAGFAAPGFARCGEFKLAHLHVRDGGEGRVAVPGGVNRTGDDF